MFLGNTSILVWTKTFCIKIKGGKKIIQMTSLKQMFIDRFWSNKSIYCICQIKKKKNKLWIERYGSKKFLMFQLDWRTPRDVDLFSHPAEPLQKIAQSALLHAQGHMQISTENKSCTGFVRSQYFVLCMCSKKKCKKAGRNGTKLEGRWQPATSPVSSPAITWCTNALATEKKASTEN